MSRTKQYLLIALVVLSLLLTGFGGLQDIFGFPGLYVSKEHAWNDGKMVMMLAILVAIVMK
jgi:hypothetical protein